MFTRFASSVCRTAAASPAAATASSLTTRSSASLSRTLSSPFVRTAAVASFSTDAISALTTTHVAVEQRDTTVWVTMNRPDLHNAFNEDVIADLTHVFRGIASEVESGTSGVDVRSVVLTGAGRSFSAGADLNWMRKMADYTEQENADDSLQLFDMFHSIQACPLPVIGRVNGAALGGGAGLVSACDVAFSVEKAKFGLTEVKLGLAPAVISRFVMDKIGKANCSRYFLTGERFGAAEAVRVGLVQQYAADEEELDALVASTVASIDENSPAAVRACKVLIDRVSHMTITESRPYVTAEIAKLRVSAEGQDGLSAFLNKRKPGWLKK